MHANLRLPEMFHQLENFLANFKLLPAKGQEPQWGNQAKLFF